jgi:putative ABC transport system permease protein
MMALLRSLRILRKNWKLTAIAVFSLSVAMALGVVSLGVSNTSLLVAPPGRAPDQLVTIYSRIPGKTIDHISYPDFQFYRQNNHSFTDVAATAESIYFARANFSGSGGSGGPLVTVTSNPVSDNYFSVLGLEPYLGRFFAAGDDGTKTPIAVLTYVGWTRLGSDPHVVGKNIGGTTIIGVAPKEFTGSLFGINGDMVVPLPENAATGRRDQRDLQLLARLKPGLGRSQAQADVTVLSAELATSYPKEDKDRATVVTRATLLPPDAIPATELAVTILLILVLLVLLIACANVANLLLAVAVGRRQEATIKLALGASRARLVREFLKESTLICAVGSAVGYLLAEIVIARYSDVAVDVPMIGTYSIGLKLHLGLTVVAATAALMLIAILATGLPAALYASKPNLSQILSGEIVIGGTRKAVRRNALVIIQVAVCTLVLVGMGLCERSLYNLRQVDPGFTARNLVAESLYPGQAQYTEAKGKEIYEEVRRKISALPGVESASLALDLPLLNNDDPVPVRLPGETKPVSVSSTVVDADYFSTLGVPVLAGRTFGNADTSTNSDVLVIDRQLAQTLWPGQDAVGRALLTGEPARKGVVIGVVGNGKYDDLAEEPQPFIYYAYSQHYQPSMNIIARTTGDPRLWIQPFAKAISDTGFDSTLRPMTFANVENLSLLPERLVAGCVAGLSALGLLLAVVGLFGAISYSVSERKKELGIRVALGAQRWQLVEMILRQTAWVAGTGIAVGIGLGIAATVLVRAKFFGIGAVEWSVLVPVGLAMLAVSLGVAYISARPWIKVDPMEAVRHA